MNKKSIIKFAKCCAHFYGVVTYADIKNAILHYNHEDVNENLIREALEDFVSPRTTIQIYKDFVYKAKIIDSMDTLVKLYDVASAHEFYYPDRKPEFYAFEASTYAWITYPYHKNLFHFLSEHLSEPDSYLIADDMCMEIAISFMAGYGPDVILETILNDQENINIMENEVQTLFQLLIFAHNNTRRYDLRGFTPTEIRDGVTSKPYLY